MLGQGRLVTIAIMLTCAFACAGAFTTVYFVIDKENERRTEVQRQSDALCLSFRTLAGIQRDSTRAQQRNTAALLREGKLTFGLSPRELAELVARGKLVQDQQIAQLERLASANCQ